MPTEIGDIKQLESYRLDPTITEIVVDYGEPVVMYFRCVFQPMLSIFRQCDECKASGDPDKFCGELKIDRVIRPSPPVVHITR